MDEYQDQQIEITLRLSAGLLGQLARLVAAVSGNGTTEEGRTVPPPTRTADIPISGDQGAVSRNFDMERFVKLAAGQAEPDLPKRQGRDDEELVLPIREAGQVEMEDSIPRRGRSMEGQETPTAPERGERQLKAEPPPGTSPAMAPTGPPQDVAAAGGTDTDAEGLSRRFERDSRRYDSGFPLY